MRSCDFGGPPRSSVDSKTGAGSRTFRSTFLSSAFTRPRKTATTATPTRTLDTVHLDCQSLGNLSDYCRAKEDPPSGGRPFLECGVFTPLFLRGHPHAKESGVKTPHSKNAVTISPAGV